MNSLPGHSDSVQSLVVSGIPAGAVLTDGTNCFMATSGNTSIDVKSWNLSNLKITPPNDTNFILTVTATDQDANTASASELVTVAPLAPYLCPVAAKGNEGTAIALDLGVMAKSLSGAHGDATPNSLDTLVVSDIPVGATLSDGTGLPGHSFTATADNTSQDVASWNLSSLNDHAPGGIRRMLQADDCGVRARFGRRYQRDGESNRGRDSRPGCPAADGKRASDANAQRERYLRRRLAGVVAGRSRKTTTTR